MPCERLPGKEDEAEEAGGGDPGEGPAGDGFADAEPLVHDVVFAEHVAAGDLDGYATEEENGGVEPEDRWDDGGEPLVNVLVVDVVAARGLGDEEGADEGDEEHEVACECAEEAEAVTA